ncbi:MAG: tryptophan-rich sensory protein [Firmicutes bacterium]|nr:tryptophan-rich sensory protein [Bacillota bacterium]
MKKKINFKKLVGAIALPIAVGAVSAWISRAGMQAFDMVKQPPLSPPKAVFPVVWTILYILMGIASYIVAEKGGKDEDNALTFYALQLGANFLWSIIFFKFGAYLFAFVWLLLLWALVYVTLEKFKKISATAGNLLVPYILWLTFAAYLNLGVYLLNR